MKDKYNLNNLLEGTKIPRFYNLEEVSIMLDIPLGTLYNMSYRKVLPCVRIGRRIRLTEEHLNQIIEKGGNLYGC